MPTQPIEIYNTLSRKKEKFAPLNPPFVGMYVCGPTVYDDVHLGNCRTFISFDLIYRYLIHIGYKVRYVRNITDAGHLEGDRDEGGDKFAKKAKLEQLEPMEIVQKYTLGFREVMRLFNTKAPSIEPTVTQRDPSTVPKLIPPTINITVRGTSSRQAPVVRITKKNTPNIPALDKYVWI